MDIAAKLGINLTETTATIRGEKVKQFVGSCPISKSTNATAFKITPHINRYVCFCSECKKLERQGGDVIEMVRRIRGNKMVEAAGEVEKLFTAEGTGKADDNAQPKQEASTERKSAGFDPLTFQRKLDPDHAALIPLGVTADTIRAFGGGFASTGFLIGRLAFPTYRGDKIAAFFGIGLPVPHDLKLHKDCTDLFAPLVLDGTVQLVDHPLKVLRAYEDGQTTLCALKPLSWTVLTTLAELAKEKNFTLEM